MYNVASLPFLTWLSVHSERTRQGLLCPLFLGFYLIALQFSLAIDLSTELPLLLIPLACILQVALALLDTCALWFSLLIPFVLVGITFLAKALHRFTGKTASPFAPLEWPLSTCQAISKVCIEQIQRMHTCQPVKP